MKILTDYTGSVSWSISKLSAMYGLDKMQQIKGLTLAPKPSLVYCTLPTDLI
jgi:hypothetical protein